MTNPINTIPIRPQLFLDNGSRLDRLETETEKSLQTEKKELEDLIFNILTNTFQNQNKSHTVKLSDDGQKIIITKQSSSKEQTQPIEIPIKNLSEPQNRQTPTQNCSIIPTELQKQTKTAFELIEKICKALKNNTSLLKQLKEWAEKTTKANTENTATAIQRVWNEALNHIRTLHRATSEPRESGSQGKAITPTATNSNNTEFDETSLKINFSKKYITYKTKDGNTLVIDLIKNTALATTLNLDAAIEEIEKKHNITVLNPSFNKSCDRAKELVQKGKFFDTHFLDIAPDTAKNSYFKKIQKAIEEKLKVLRADSKNNETAIQNLEKFKNALEKKSRKKPNGVDWFAVNLAIDCHKQKKEQQQLMRKQINDAVQKELTSLKIPVGGNPAATDYAIDIFLLSLTRQKSIEFLEKQTSANRRLLPNESKESLLARACLHGFEDINNEDFKNLFGVELSPEIQEILNPNAPKLPTGDVVLGIEGGVKTGSSAGVPRNPSNSPPSSSALSAFSSETPENGSQSSTRTYSFGSSTSSTDTPRGPPMGAASKTAIMPETIAGLVEGITQKTTDRPTPYLITRRRNTDIALREKITKFVDKISKDVTPPSSTSPRQETTNSAPPNTKEPSTPQDTSENESRHKMILQALWMAATNKQRGQLIDIAEFLKSFTNKDTIPEKFTTALETPNNETIQAALDFKKERENASKKMQDLKEKKKALLDRKTVLTAILQEMPPEN